MNTYKQKYKEAMSFLKDLRPHMSDYCKEKLDGFFPELKESEDERIRKKLISFVENWTIFNLNSPFDDYPIYTSDKSTVDKILAWLEKQGEQKPAVWSEEDEKKLQDVIYWFEIFCEKNQTKPEMKESLDWLKSIKPQNRWKPSEEQLRVLQIAIRDYGICAEKNVLESLYNDLKNL